MASTLTNPKYLRIAEDLKGKINSGYYKNGKQLPSLQKLIAGYDASLNTVRQSIQRLITEGLVRAEHGRGVFVNEHLGNKEIIILVSNDRMMSSSSPFHSEICAILTEAIISRLKQSHVKILPLNKDWTSAQASWVLGTNGDMLSKAFAVIDLTIGLATKVLPNLADQTTTISISHKVTDLEEESANSDYKVFLDSASYLPKVMYYLSLHNCKKVGIVNLDNQDILTYESVNPDDHRRQVILSQPMYGRSVFEIEKAGYELFENVWLNHERPDGLIVLDDVICRGMLRATLKYGIELPDSMRLISHANRQLPIPYHKQITRFEFDWLKLVDAAISILLTLEKGQKPLERKFVVPPDFIIGETA